MCPRGWPQGQLSDVDTAKDPHREISGGLFEQSVGYTGRWVASWRDGTQRRGGFAEQEGYPEVFSPCETPK